MHYQRLPGRHIYVGVDQGRRGLTGNIFLLGNVR